MKRVIAIATIALMACIALCAEEKRVGCGRTFMDKPEFCPLLISPPKDLLAKMRSGTMLTADEMKAMLATGFPQHYVEEFNQVPEAVMPINSYGNTPYGNFRGLLVKDKKGLSMALFEERERIAPGISRPIFNVWYASSPSISRDDTMTIVSRFYSLTGFMYQRPVEQK